MHMGRKYAVKHIDKLKALCALLVLCVGYAPVTSLFLTENMNIRPHLNINTLSPRQIDHHFADNIFKLIIFNGNFD